MTIDTNYSSISIGSCHYAARISCKIAEIWEL